MTYSPLWGTSLTLIKNVTPLRRQLAQLLNRRSLRKDRELAVTLLGAVAGSAALDRYTRVAHSTTQLGGVRSIETIDLVNRNTAAADDTDISANILAFTSRPTTYPVDRSLTYGRPWNAKLYSP